MTTFESDAIREVVAEGMTRPIPGGIERDVAIPRLAERASVLKGVRRCGKTYRMYQRMRELLARGIERSDMLFVDFEDDRLEGASDNVIGDVAEAYMRATAGRGAERRYLFFDEVQNVDGWGRPLRRLTQNPQFEICVSGSSARMLSDDIATEFRGRGISAEVYPLSFREFLRGRGIEAPADAGFASPELGRVCAAAFCDYLDVGGFPEVQGADGPTRVAALQDVVWTIAARDLAERHGLPLSGTRRFMQRALRMSGREFSANKVYNALRSMHVPLSKADAHALPELCEDAYLFFLVSRFGATETEASQGKRKLYAIDPGLQFALGPASSADLGQRLEDAVYVELRRRLRGDPLSSIGFYRTAGGFEVDFCVGDADTREPSELYQVSARVRDEGTLRREVRALSQALDETGLGRGILIVLDAHEVPDPGDPRIRVIDAWRWMLGTMTTVVQ